MKNKDRNKINKKILNCIDNQNEFHIVKRLGEGLEGIVNLIKMKKYNIALKIIELNKKEENGYPEVYSSRLINLLLEKNINPHFIYNYKTLKIENKLLNFNEYIKGESLRNFLRKKKHKKDLLFNILFQIISALYSLKTEFNMIHGDLHFENILVKKIKKIGYWEYKIGENNYYLPNMGYQIFINDYGYAMIPGVIGKKWYYSLFEKIKNTSMYDLYDMFLIKLEMFKFLNPEFYTFFKDYFSEKNTDDYRHQKINVIPEDLDLGDIIKLMFSKNEISNCKNKYWLCYDEKPSNIYGDLIESYNLDEQIKNKEISDILSSKIEKINIR